MTAILAVYILIVSAVVLLAVAALAFHLDRDRESGRAEPEVIVRDNTLCPCGPECPVCLAVAEEELETESPISFIENVLDLDLPDWQKELIREAVRTPGSSISFEVVRRR